MLHKLNRELQAGIYRLEKPLYVYKDLDIEIDYRMGNKT